MKLVYKLVSILLIFLNAAGAWYGGLKFILDPSGKSMGLSKQVLQFTFFDNYLIPGIILLTINGLFGIIVFVTVIIGAKIYSTLIILQGLLLGGWIIIQMILLHQINALQTLFLVISLLLIVLGMLQAREKVNRF